MNFPSSISLTITNVCNLRYQMCGQWSTEGGMHSKKAALKQEMCLDDWKQVVDELAAYQVGGFGLRGGEPFLCEAKFMPEIEDKRTTNCRPYFGNERQFVVNSIYFFGI